MHVASLTRSYVFIIFFISVSLLQASMLVFYPDFEVDSSPASDEVVLLVDSSESMKGEPLHSALRIARRVLGTLDPRLKINVIFFGTGQFEPFLLLSEIISYKA